MYLIQNFLKTTGKILLLLCVKNLRLFFRNNYLKQEDCFIPDDQKIFKDVESQVVVKDLPKILNLTHFILNLFIN